jgi:hypothetical protein
MVHPHLHVAEVLGSGLAQPDQMALGIDELAELDLGSGDRAFQPGFPPEESGVIAC